MAIGRSHRVEETGPVPLDGVAARVVVRIVVGQRGRGADQLVEFAVLPAALGLGRPELRQTVASNAQHRLVAAAGDLLELRQGFRRPGGLNHREPELHRRVGRQGRGPVRQVGNPLRRPDRGFRRAGLGQRRVPDPRVVRHFGGAVVAVHGDHALRDLGREVPILEAFGEGARLGQACQRG